MPGGDQDLAGNGGFGGVGLAVPALRAQEPARGAQPVSHLRARPFSDTTLVRLLADCEFLAEKSYLREAGVFVRVLAMPRTSGSAGMEGDQVTYDLYFIVSDFGEERDRRAYRVGPLYRPRLVRVVLEDGTPTAYVTYGTSARPRRARVQWTLERVTIGEAKPQSTK